MRTACAFAGRSGDVVVLPTAAVEARAAAAAAGIQAQADLLETLEIVRRTHERRIVRTHSVPP